MTLINYKTTNNAETTLFATISASATSLISNTDEWDLFPIEFPFLCTLEKFSWENIIKREIIKVTNRSWDAFTIERWIEECVQDETASPKILSSNGLEFTAWSKLSLYNTAWNEQDMKAELVRLESEKVNQSEYDLEKNVFWASSEWDDDYVITDASLISYNDWQPIRFRVDVANTWAATLQINALWSKSLKKQQWTEDLITWDILANWIVTAVYNSTLDVFQFVWQLATVVSWENPIFWNWSDWVLNITSWTTYLNLNQEYNFSSINISAWAILSTNDTEWVMILKCNWTTTIDWTIELTWKQCFIWREIFVVWIGLLEIWEWWDWWNWWMWSTTNAWWLLWASEFYWFGGGWWWWSAVAVDWWNWWSASYIWWVWWEWSVVIGSVTWKDWWNSAWWSWWNYFWNSWAWWDSFSNDWIDWTTVWSWWWGGGWWAWWIKWWWIIIFTISLIWAWLINCIWDIWWDWWASADNANLGAWDYMWWGGWWWWGGGWIIWIWTNSDSSSITLDVSWWLWWTWWVGKQDNWVNQALAFWDDWIDWAIWTWIITII